MASGGGKQGRLSTAEPARQSQQDRARRAKAEPGEQGQQSSGTALDGRSATVATPATTGIAPDAACNFSQRHALRFVGDFLPPGRAEEDARLRALFAPWQEALEELIHASGHTISEPPPQTVTL